MADVLERKIRPVSEVEDLALTQREAVDLGPDREELVAHVGRTSGRDAGVEKGPPPSAKPVPVHGEPIRGPEGPGERPVGSTTVATDAPQAEQRLLGDVRCLLIAEPKPTHEAEELLCVLGMNLLNDLPRGGSWSIAFRGRWFVRHGDHVGRRSARVKRCTRSPPGNGSITVALTGGLSQRIVGGDLDQVIAHGH